MNKLSKIQTVVLVVAVLALGTGIGVFIESRVSAPAQIPQIIDDVSASDPLPTLPVLINVYVTGAVTHPDVYALPEGAIVKDALMMAGGSTEDADLIGVNLAARLQDGDQVTVPAKTAGGTDITVVPTSPASSTRTRVSINRATLAELDTLPGIGPAKAQAILDYRSQHGQFKRLEDLQNVKGIGPATFEDLKQLITL
ncbi:MAG: helix-hairpin-helix domain-containing protein [Candidatus Cryosericum sp.]